MNAIDETGEGVRGHATLHPVVHAVRGTDRPTNGRRLSHAHLEQRDRALAAIERATKEVEKLEDVERGSVTTETSPRLKEVREVKGELTHLVHRLDSTYV